MGKGEGGALDGPENSSGYFEEGKRLKETGIL
jgi:hypothetical protein